MPKDIISVIEKATIALWLLIGYVNPGHSQDSLTGKHLPIIDVHVHAMKVNPAFGGDMCPWFLKNMPGGDPNQPAPQFINGDCIMLEGGRMWKR